MLRRLLELLGILPEERLRNLDLDVHLHTRLVSLAEEQQRSPGELAADLVEQGLARQAEQEDVFRRWDSLTSRQQQVAALICLGFTNRQIAGQLGIAISTVHSHSLKIQSVFEVNSKAGLISLFAGWDFRSIVK